MALMSDGVGLGAAIGGASLLALVCAIVLGLFRRQSSWAAVQVVAPASGPLPAE
jgi:hypothetical protein